MLYHHLHDHLADHLNSPLHNNSIDHHLCSAVGVGVGRPLYSAIRAVIYGKAFTKFLTLLNPTYFGSFKTQGGGADLHLWCLGHLVPKK